MIHDPHEAPETDDRREAGLLGNAGGWRLEAERGGLVVDRQALGEVGGGGGGHREVVDHRGGTDALDAEEGHRHEHRCLSIKGQGGWRLEAGGPRRLRRDVA
jgi:hypothetical protein